MKNIPEKIYLQVNPENEDLQDVDFNNLVDVTYCTERINKTDLEYVLIK